MRNNLKKTFIFSVSLYLCAGIMLSPALAEEKPIGKVLAVTGTVEFRANEGPAPVAQQGGAEVKPVSFTPWQKVTFQQPIYVKDEFRTSRLSRVKILFMDNSLLALGPNSQMRVASYLYSSKDKLRQGVIGVAHGLSMYIVNKSQKNKKSFFKIVTPTANLAARGTHGYISTSPDATLVANQAGAMITSNSDPSVEGLQVVGRMMKATVSKGQPPTLPTRLTRSDIKMIRSVVMGRIGASSRARPGEKPLIKETEPEAEPEAEAAPDTSGGSETTMSAPASGGGKLAPVGVSRPSDSSGHDGFADSFASNTDVGPDFGGQDDFAPVNEPFDATVASACTP